MVAESYATSVSEVADQYGLSKTQLFTWRRDAWGGGAEETPEPIFAPGVVLNPPAEATAARGEASRKGPPHAPGRDRAGGRSDPGLEEDAVIAPPSGVRVLMATKPADFRKGANGLAALIKDEIKADPLSGVVYVFRAKRADRIKLLYWDGTGVVLMAKTLEQGGFR